MPESAPSAVPVTPAVVNGAAKPAPAPTATPVKPVTKDSAAPASAVSDESFEVTIAGEKRKMSKADLIKAASKVGFADKMSQQAKEALRVLREREAEIAKRESFWDDDDALEAELERRGKLDKLARKRLEKKVSEAQLTPEQQEAARIKDANAELQKKLDEREAADKEAKKAETQKAVQAQMEKQLAESAERAGMPKDPDSFYAIYEAVKESVDLGLPWDADRIVATAQENIDHGFKRLEQSVLKSLKGQALVNRLGPEVVKEVLRYRAELLRNGGARPPPQAAAPRAPSEPTLSTSSLVHKYRGGA